MSEESGVRSTRIQVQLTPPRYRMGTDGHPRFIVIRFLPPFGSGRTLGDPDFATFHSGFPVRSTKRSEIVFDSNRERLCPNNGQGNISPRPGLLSDHTPSCPSPDRETGKTKSSLRRSWTGVEKLGLHRKEEGEKKKIE